MTVDHKMHLESLHLLARPLQKCVGDFDVQILELIPGDFPEGFSGHFSHKTGEKIQRL